MSCVEPLVINRHSGAVVSFNWKNADETNANLTGWTLAVVDKSTAINSLVSAVITTESTGLITITITWDDALVANQEYYFRIKLTKSGELPKSSNLITVVYQ